MLILADGAQRSATLDRQVQNPGERTWESHAGDDGRFRTTPPTFNLTSCSLSAAVTMAGRKRTTPVKCKPARSFGMAHFTRVDAPPDPSWLRLTLTAAPLLTMCCGEPGEQPAVSPGHSQSCQPLGCGRGAVGSPGSRPAAGWCPRSCVASFPAVAISPIGWWQVSGGRTLH